MMNDVDRSLNSDLLELVENFLRSELSISLSKDALTACGSLSNEQLSLLSSHVEEWDRALHKELAQSVESTSRPPSVSVPASARTFSAIYSHPYNGLRSTEIDQVKRQLLFFPKVAIIRPQLSYSTVLSQRRSSAMQFFQILLELRECLLDGLVELTPLSGFYSDEIEGGAGLIRRACIEDKGVAAWIRSKGDLVTDFSTCARRGDPFFDAGIRIASALTYGHELVATHPFVGELYAKLMQSEGGADSQITAVGTNLKRIALPGLSGLTWREIRSIRQDEPSFRRWCADLQDVIASVDQSLSPERFVERFNAIAKARLARAALELDHEVKKSATLTRAKTGIATFTIGAVAALATSVTFGVPVGTTLWATVLKSAETGGISAGLQFLWASKRSVGTRALRSHYSVFAQT
jgi:uncharacterized membrane protein YfbV (UPF0208 family)